MIKQVTLHLLDVVDHSTPAPKQELTTEASETDCAAQIAEQVFEFELRSFTCARQELNISLAPTCLAQLPFMHKIHVQFAPHTQNALRASDSFFDTLPQLSKHRTQQQETSQLNHRVKIMPWAHWIHSQGTLWADLAWQ